jgi:hypothetical protein
MSKNLTLKGAAFGALVALSISAVAPASAAGLADNSFVSLAPTTGTAYTVVAGAGKTFSLTANEASTIAGGDVKFLVSDASDVVEVANGTTGRTAFTVDQTSGAEYTAVASTDVVTINVDASTALAVGDYISFANAIDANGATAGVVQAANTPVKVTAVTSTTSFAFKASADIASNVSVAAALDGTNSITTVVQEARDTTAHNFVVDTETHTASTNSTLVLQTTESTVVTRSVDVTAWVDSNDNDTLDSTEYASPTRTVVFKKASEITGAVTWTAPTLGDTSLVAKVATTPELNGSQMSANDVSVKFTRQGSTSTGLAASDTTTPSSGSTAWNSTDKLWVATAYTGQSADNTPWAGLVDSSANDVVFAGTYSARPYIGSDAIATAVSTTVGSTQADDVKATITATADNAAAANETAASATAVVVRTGKSVTVTAKVYDNASTPALVGAGIPVTATLSSTTGTIKVNATATSDQELTDANGVVTFVVSTTSALASDAATLTIQAQNVSTNTKQAAYTITWDDATATLYDAAVANAYSDVTRSTTVGGSQSFSFKIADQFKQALTGSYRLKVANTGRTVSTTYATVTAGAATVSVTDGTVGSGTSISTAIDLEKDVSGTWTAQDLTNDGNSDGSADTVTYTINLLTQTDAITLDVDAATVYGSGTADDSDAIAAAATAALDTRASFTTVPTYTNAVTVTGRVANATTAAVRAGALVTVSGDSSILFSTGGVYAFGSITFVADSSGEFSVDAFSTKAATDSVVTVTSNGVSATRKVTFTKGARDTASAISITAAKAVKSGKTFYVTVNLADKFGNAVVTDSAAAGYSAGSTTPSVSITYTGPGFVTSTIPSVTDAKGQIKFVVLLGSDDSGFGTVSAAYDSNGSTTDVAGTTLTASATHEILLGISGTVTAAKKAATAVVKNALGGTVTVVSGTKSVTKVATSDNFKLSLTKLTAGKKTVKVYVNDVLVVSKSVTVKK